MKIRLSAKELVLNPALVRRAQELGIDLAEFTPLASKEKIVDGGKYIHGASGYSGAVGFGKVDKDKKKSFASSFFSNDGNGFDSDFAISDAMKYAAYAGQLSAANNIKPSRVPLAEVIPPSLYSKSFNTDYLTNQNRMSRVSAIDFAKARGVNPLTAISAIHAQETDNNLKIGQQAANYEAEVENKNTDLLNSYNQNRANSLYQRSLAQQQENKYNAERTGAMKGEAIAGLINTTTGAEQRAFDRKNYNQSALSSTAANRTFSFIQTYADKLPQGVNKDTIFDLILNKGYSDEQIKKHFGIS